MASTKIHVLKIFIFASGLSDKSWYQIDRLCLSDRYLLQNFEQIMRDSSQSLQFATYLWQKKDTTT